MQKHFFGGGQEGEVKEGISTDMMSLPCMQENPSFETESCSWFCTSNGKYCVGTIGSFISVTVMLWAMFLKPVSQNCIKV